ncbi:MAG: thioredoxin family protein [Saprospiraceae bacterium]|nr:thioredoxin family protein [Saprospiraceae bacterium]
MKRLTGIFGCLSLALLFAFTLPVNGGYKVGDKVADFSLQNAIDDQWVSLASYGDVKGYIVVFTCNTCPYSVMYEDRLIELHNTYAPQGFPVVAINPNDPGIKPGDSYAAMKERADSKGFTFKYLFDAEQTVFPAFGATRTPHVFLLDKKKVVRYIGAIDNNAQNASAADKPYVAQAIEALKNGDDPNPDFTKAIGCTIKVKS